METKKCSKCLEEKPLELFNKSNRHPKGRFSWCKACKGQLERKRYHSQAPERRMRVKELMRKQYEKTKVKRSEDSRLKRYGITAEEFRGLLEKQGGRCACCSRGLDLGKHTHVDHDHSDGRIRGILCRECNVAIGLCHDSLERVMALYLYLLNAQKDKGRLKE